MSRHLSTEQIRELIEIDALGHGIGDAVRVFIRRLTSGAEYVRVADARRVQAKRLWDFGVGEALGHAVFDAYLATIPEVPAALVADGGEFPLLVLVEPRLGLSRLCDYVDVSFAAKDTAFVAYDERQGEQMNAPYWIRAQDGRRNRGRDPSDCRESFGKSELGLTAIQGVCTYVQHPLCLGDTLSNYAHSLILPGSVRPNNRGGAACLVLFGGKARLDWDTYVAGPDRFGSASRREC